MIPLFAPTLRSTILLLSLGMELQAYYAWDYF